MIDPEVLKGAVERACGRIAPTWPLDRSIAVNPFWPLIHEPLPKVAGDLAALSGGRLLMSREWYAAQWRAGRLRPEHLREAIEESAADVTVDDLTASFWIGDPTPSRRPQVVDVMEKLLHREHEMTWREFVMERISRFCAAYFDDGQAQISGVKEGGLYASWRAQSRGDRLPRMFMGLGEYRATSKTLPKTTDEMIARGCADLGVPADQLERYLAALLLDVNGWSSWCAYLRWTARQAGDDDDHLRELLAVRLAWEWILFSASDDTIRAEWQYAMASWPAIDRAAQVARSDDWILQRAVEIAWISEVRPRLPEGFGATPPATPTLQAAFCLDVRSEIYRRALEAQGQGIQTLGVAGFFGLPVEYLPLAADDARPQLPALLAPKYRITDTGVRAGLGKQRRARLDAGNAWKAFKSSSLSSFAFVDTMGPFFARNLYRDVLGRGTERSDRGDRAGLTELEDRTRRPRLTSRVDGTPLTLEERCEIAEGFLRTIGLTRTFARVVLLVGHGSETKNNAHGAGLDCGACCGQPGDANARAAAALLNDALVRAALAARGIEVPPTTLFVGALHNTTTDEVTLFEEDAGFATHPVDLADVQSVLHRASVVTRRERAPRLGLGELSDAKLHAAVVKRARSWAEVRPEWGLAGNAVFIVAPRERSRHLDLEGRAFLHDYRADDDQHQSILEAIMTGPLVVADCNNKPIEGAVVTSVPAGTVRYDSGSLPSSSATATAAAIESVLRKHQKVRDLVENGWVHLFQIEPDGTVVRAYRGRSWHPVA
jgi:uncharacterized protein YbcC (UPF0753/DUF2309 family)